MQNDTNQEYLKAKYQSDSPEDLIGRLLFKLIGLQNSGNAQIGALSSLENVKRQEAIKFGQTSELQREAIARVLLEIKKSIEEKEIDLSDVIQVLSHIAGSNSALYEVFERVSGNYPEMLKQLARIAELTAENKPQEVVFDELVKANDKSFSMIGKLIVNLTEAVKSKNFPEDLKISGPVEIAKPKWWKPFEFSWDPIKELFEKLKSHTFSVKVENQFEFDKNLFKNFPEDVAKKLSKVLEENLPKIRISGGGGGNPFTFLPGGALKVSTGEEGSAGGAQETTLQDVLTQLQAINTNTDGLEINAENINLNTDTLEALLTQIRDYVDALEANTTGLADNATLIQVRDYLDQVETKIDALNTELQTKTKPSDIQLGELIPVMRNILQAVANPSFVDKTLNRMRQTAILESGTVTTVTTVTGLTNIDGYQGKLLVINQNISAWANNVRARIS